MNHVYSRRAKLRQTRPMITGGPAMECVCGAISVDGCGPKGPCPGRPKPLKYANGDPVEPSPTKPNDVLIMEVLVELIDWAGPPNMRGRLLDAMQAELNRRLAANRV